MESDVLKYNSEYNVVEKSTQNTVFHPRLAWMIYYKQVHSIKMVCEKFGISRKTFYKWWMRYFKSGYKVESLFDLSKKPHNSPYTTPIEIIQKILEARESTGYGVRKLKNYLLKNYNIRISEHTIWKILKKYKFNEKEITPN
ncbi:MAG: hypothetical protein IGBAC_1654 [Ignavibacteriae bacterium]|nr:MAG: hypothetical protein IGBAC_1654 [Ignavibacteriota bacterium]